MLTICVGDDNLDSLELKNNFIDIFLKKNY